MDGNEREWVWEGKVIGSVRYVWEHRWRLMNEILRFWRNNVRFAGVRGEKKHQKAIKPHTY